MSVTARHPPRSTAVAAPSAVQRYHRPGALTDSLTVALFATAISAIGAARPSLWFDEAATISASTRSLPALWALLHNIDAVHGLYYLLMHGWFAVFPVTEFWTRLSSCVAVGIAAAGVVVLGRQLSTRSVGVCAGLTFAILPRVTWAGIEARSYALTAAAAVWMTVLLVAVARRNAVALWPLYGFAVVTATLLNVFVVLIVAAHAVAVAVLAGRRSTVVWWAVTAATAVLIVSPFIAFCRTQIAQVRWISPVDAGTVGVIAEQQYFDHSVPFAVLAGAAVAVPLVWRRARPADGGTRRLALICAAWMALPTAGLVLYSWLAVPIYYPRYLCYTAPAAALLLGICIVAVARGQARVVTALVVFAVAAAPNYVVTQRGPYAKERMDFSQVADVITARAAPGDCLILDNTTAWKPGPIRPITAARPAAYAKLVDPTRGQRAVERNGLWDAHQPIWLVKDQIRRCAVLWTVSERDTTMPDRQSSSRIEPGPRLRRAPAYQIPQELGFHLVERWQFSFAQVVKSTR